MADLPTGIDQASTDRAEINAIGEHHGGEDETVEIVAIRSDIEHTRHDIEETLEAIKEKLNPQVVLEQAKEHARDVAVDALDAARDNVKESISATVENVKDTVGDAMHNAADSVSNAVQNVSDTVSNAVQSAKDKVGDMFGGKDKGEHTVDTAIDAMRGASPPKPAVTVNKRIGGVMSGMSGAGTNALDTVKRNPVPTALIAVGATYLYLKHRDDNKVPSYTTRDYDYTDYEPVFPTSQPIDSLTGDEEIIIIETVSDVDGRGSLTSGSGSSGASVGSSLLNTVSQNPLPIAAAVLGATWLIMRSRDNGGDASYRRDNYADYLPPDTSGPNIGSRIGDAVDAVKGKAGDVSDTVSGAVGSAKDKVSDAVSGAKDKVTDVVGSAKDKVTDAVGTAKDKVTDVVGSTKDKVGDVVDSAKDKVSSAMDTAKDKAGQASSAVSSAMSAAKDKATQVTGQARDKASQLGSSAMEQTRKAQGAVSDTFHDNPMAYGLVALGIGAAVGLLIPATEPENRFMGQKRDELFNRAQTAASDIATKVQTVAENTLDVAKTTAAYEAKHAGLTTE